MTDFVNLAMEIYVIAFTSGFENCLLFVIPGQKKSTLYSVLKFIVKLRALN